MLDPLSLLRSFYQGGKLKDIVEVNGTIVFGLSSWPKDTKTTFPIHTSNTQDGGIWDHYTLEDLLNFPSSVLEPDQPGIIDYLESSIDEVVNDMSDPVSVLRSFYQNGKLDHTVEVDGRIVFGVVSYPKDSKTCFRIHGSRSWIGKWDHYTLGNLLHFPTEMQAADQADLIGYFEGEIQEGDMKSVDRWGPEQTGVKKESLGSIWRNMFARRGSSMDAAETTWFDFQKLEMNSTAESADLVPMCSMDKSVNLEEDGSESGAISESETAESWQERNLPNQENNALNEPVPEA